MSDQGSGICVTRWKLWPASQAAPTMSNFLMAVSSAHLSVRLHAGLREVWLQSACLVLNGPEITYKAEGAAGFVSPAGAGSCVDVSC